MLPGRALEVSRGPAERCRCVFFSPPGGPGFLERRKKERNLSLAPSSFFLSPLPSKKNSQTGARRTLVYLILTLNAAYPDYDFGGLRARHFRKEAGLAAVEDAVDSHLLEVARVWDATPGHGGGGGGSAVPESSGVGGDGEGAAAAGGGGGSGGGTPLLDALWRALDDAASLAECDVYSYRPDGSGGNSGGDLGGNDGGGCGNGASVSANPGQASDCYEGGDPFADEGALWSFNFFFHNRRLKRIVYFACRGVSKSAGSYEGGAAGRYFGALGSGDGESGGGGGGANEGAARGGRRGDGLGGVGLGLGGSGNNDGDDYDYDDGRGLSSSERYNSDGDDGYRDPPVVVGSRGALPQYGGVEVDDDEDVYGDRRSRGGRRGRGRRNRRGRSEEEELDDDDENADAVADVVAEALADDTAVAIAVGNGVGVSGLEVAAAEANEDVAGEIDDL